MTIPMTAERWNAFGFLASFFLALLLVFWRSSQETITTFVVMGQGHFFLAYLYQWRAGKINARYGIVYVLTTALLLYALATLPNPSLWTLVLAGLIFSIHFAVDELFINGLPNTRERTLLVTAFTLAYSALLVRSAYGILWAPLSLLVIVLLVPLIVRALREKVITLPEALSVSGIGILLILWFVPQAFTLASVLGFIILLHYMRWYFFYFFKLYVLADHTRLYGYIRDVILVNGVVLTGFIVFMISPTAATVLKYMFDPLYFYLWTVLHVVSSVRMPAWAPSFLRA